SPESCNGSWTDAGAGRRGDHAPCFLRRLAERVFGFARSQRGLRETPEVARQRVTMRMRILGISSAWIALALPAGVAQPEGNLKDSMHTEVAGSRGGPLSGKSTV